jgi:hypothetical protein
MSASAEREWAERLAAPRAELNQADAELLKSLARARGESTDDRRPAALDGHPGAGAARHALP